MTWGPETFGDPCRECGFGWDLKPASAEDMIRQAPDAFARFVPDDTVGKRRVPELGWNVAGYISHVSDSIRVWSERIVTVTGGSDGSVGPYDQDLLAAARRYDQIPAHAALWSLSRAAADWQAALATIDETSRSFLMRHGEMGDMTATDVIRIRAHDVHHHRMDIQRIIGATR